MGWTRRIALLGLAVVLASTSGVSARPGVVEALPVEEAWSVEVDEAARRIYVLGDPGLVAFDADSYERLAEVDLPGNPSDLAHDTGRDLLFVSGRRHVSIVDAETFTVVRSKEMDGYKTLSPLAVDERTGFVYVGVYARKLILVLDGDSLAVRDKVKLGSRYTSAYPTDVTVDPARHRLHVADIDGKVHIYDTRTLEREATVRIGAWADGSFLALDREEGVLYATADNTLKALDAATGLRSWGLSLPTTPGRLALDSANGFLHIVTVPRAGMPGELLIVNVPKRRLEHRFELVPGEELFTNDVAVDGVTHRSYAAEPDGGVLVVDLDATPPYTLLDSSSRTVLGPGDVVKGWSYDAESGISDVEVTFATGPLVEKVPVDMRCHFHRRECKWKAQPPGPGVYEVTISAIDRSGNAEVPRKIIVVSHP